MPPSSLPTRLNLECLRNQARVLPKACRARHQSGIPRLPGIVNPLFMARGR